MTRALVLLLVAAFALAGLQTYRLDGAKLAIATMQRDAEAARAGAELSARTHEYQAAIAANVVAESYEKGKTDAQATADAVVAGLGAGAVRLREQWRSCEAGRVSQAAAAARFANAIEQSRNESAGRIVRIAAECDAQVTGLQSFIAAERAAVH